MWESLSIFKSDEYKEVRTCVRVAYVKSKVEEKLKAIVCDDLDITAQVETTQKKNHDDASQISVQGTPNQILGKSTGGMMVFFK